MAAGIVLLLIRSVQRAVPVRDPGTGSDPALR
jgi:hypothetical protein